MSDEKFKISLRTKRKPRPAISAPQQISKPVPQGADSTPRNAGGKAAPPPSSGKTSDLVKRRYSTRFNNLPPGFDAAAPPIPSVPAAPGQTRGPAIQVDLSAIRNPTLKADQYVAGILADASEQDIDDYQKQLQSMRNRTSTDLQKNVYHNRSQFIKISKEAEKLKGEMRALRSLMSELKSNTTALRSASSSAPETTSFDDGFPSTMSKRDKRSSVMDRTALWNSQLQALWKNVAGSQKFLPASPGRHIIQNAGRWVELDSATWKARRSMQMILLNDHLLVASRRKRSPDEASPSNGQQAPLKLVADRCWPLLDIEIVDLAATTEAASSRNNVSNAIMIRGVGQESFTYRAEEGVSSEKTSLLLNFRRAVEELRKGLRSEIESSNKSKETQNYLASRDPNLLKKAELLESMADVKDRPNMLIEVDGKQQTLRWVESQFDELDIKIALQRFEEAVDLLEKLRALGKSLKNNAIAQDFVNFKADERARKLAGMVARELVDTHNERSKTKRNVGWLFRLGFEDRAREAYLEARGQTIHKRSRQCIFEGNLQQYIWELSFVYFTIIKNTVSVYHDCFPPPMMSACVTWAKEQVAAFNVILLRQLSNTDKSEQRWIESMDQAKRHAKMLAEVGLDFDNMIGREPPVYQEYGGGRQSAADSSGRDSL